MPRLPLLTGDCIKNLSLPLLVEYLERKAPLTDEKDAENTMRGDLMRRAAREMRSMMGELGLVPGGHAST